MSDTEDLFEGVELADEELEGIAGGLGPKSQSGWLELIQRAKVRGWDLEHMIEYVRTKIINDLLANEIIQFVRENW